MFERPRAVKYAGQGQRSVYGVLLDASTDPTICEAIGPTGSNLISTPFRNKPAKCIVLGASNLTYASPRTGRTGPYPARQSGRAGQQGLLRHHPQINRTYGATPAHYSVGTATRPGSRGRGEIRPDLHSGRLRGLTFFSLAECNEAIALVMNRMNDRPMRNLGLSRRELFEKIERDALIALLADDWEFAEWRRARVNLDYHIEVHQLRAIGFRTRDILLEVDVRITARTVETFPSGPTRRRPSAPLHGPQTRHGPRPGCPAPTGATPRGMPHWFRRG